MPGIVQLQRQYSPFQRMLPQFLSNLYFQNSAQRYQTQRAEEERKQQEEDTLRQYKTKGYRESEAHIPDVEVAGKGLMAPKPEFEIKMMGGKPFIVKSIKKYGGESTPIEMTEMKEEAGKYKVGELKEFKVGDKIVIGEYTGEPTDNLSGVTGWKETGAGGPRYKPTTNVNIDNKIMPATEVSKIGEFKAYQDTMTEIETIIDKGEGNVTGPFEFIKKRVDNWGVMPSKERITMRSLVSRLPGLMYAMRGKQLSDKELEVALDMMPQMNMDEVAFGIQLKKFNEYMDTILQGKKEAFGGAGYKTGGFPDKMQPGHTTKNLDQFWEK